MPKLEIPPNFHGYVLESDKGLFKGISVAGLPSPDGSTHWDIWRWGQNSTPPDAFSIGAPAIQRTTRAQDFPGPVGLIEPTIGLGQKGFTIEYAGVLVGAVVFGPAEADAQWWMYQTPYTSGGLLPQPSASKPLDFKVASSLSTGQGWKGQPI